MENFLWVFYFIILLAATSCALQTEAATAEEVTAAAGQDHTEMVTNPTMEVVTIAGQGSENSASGSTIYVTLPPEDQSPEAGSVAPTSTHMPSMSTTEVAPPAAPQQPSSSPQVSQTTAPPIKGPTPAPPQVAANEIPERNEDKPMAASKNSHEKPRGMDNGAFPTTSSLPILVGVIALTLVVHS